MRLRSRDTLTWLVLSAVVWALGMALLVHAGRTGQFDATCERYMTICPGDVRRSAIWMTIDAAVLAALTAPLDVENLSTRLGAVAAFTFFYSMMLVGVGMHGGKDIFAHALWLFGISCLLGIASTSTVVRSIIRTHRQRTTNTQ